jgi:hypothetical protein
MTSDDKLDLVWLAVQLRQYPNRVHPERTVNIGTLLELAAKQVERTASLKAEVARRDAIIRVIQGAMLEAQFGWSITKLNKVRPLIEALSQPPVPSGDH